MAQYLARPFLYLYARQPEEKEAVNDELTTQMEEIFGKESAKKENQGTKGYSPNTKRFRARWGDNAPFQEGGGFLGVHVCVCGAQSTSNDYLVLERYVTNSLCVHYLRHHRSECAEADLRIVGEVVALYKTGKWPRRVPFPAARAGKK